MVKAPSLGVLSLNPLRHPASPVTSPLAFLPQRQTGIEGPQREDVKIAGVSSREGAFPGASRGLRWTCRKLVGAKTIVVKMWTHFAWVPGMAGAVEAQTLRKPLVSG